MSDPKFNLNPVEGPEDAEIFKYIEANSKTWSTPIPELQAIYKQNGIPKVWLPTKEGIVAGRTGSAKGVARFMQTPFVKQTLGEISAPECSVSERTITGSTGVEIPVRIYHPWPGQTGLPILIMLHGGGFCTGDLNTEVFLCRLLCRSLQVIIMDVQYRLPPEHTLDDSRTDAYDAAVWTSKNGHILGGDVRKGLILAGCSSGGIHAVTAIYRARDNNLQPGITGILVISTGGMTEWAPLGAHFYPGRMLSATENEFAPFSAKETNDCFTRIAGFRLDDPELTVFYRTDHSNLPPMYWQTAGMDSVRDGAIYYQHLYRRAGNKCRGDIYSGVPHMWWVFYSQLSVTQRWARDLVAGTQWLLQQSHPDTGNARL